MPIQQRTVRGKVDYQVEQWLRDITDALNSLEPEKDLRAATGQALAQLEQQFVSLQSTVNIIQQGGGGGGGGGGGSAGITQLTGDVLAGPGSGSVPATLATTAVTPGAYGNATTVGQFTVDAKGRLTAAANVAITFPTPPADQDYVVMSDGATPTPSPVDDGFGNFIYIPYTP